MESDMNHLMEKSILMVEIELDKIKSRHEWLDGEEEHLWMKKEGIQESKGCQDESGFICIGSSSCYSLS